MKNSLILDDRSICFRRVHGLLKFPTVRFGVPRSCVLGKFSKVYMMLNVSAVSTINVKHDGRYGLLKVCCQFSAASLVPCRHRRNLPNMSGLAFGSSAGVSMYSEGVILA